MTDRRDYAGRKARLWQEFVGHCRQEGMVFQTEIIVCPSCGGEGAYVNPNIDRNGITQSDEVWDDEEFWEGYASGTYDVPCEECGGRNVIQVPTTPEVRDEWGKWLNSMYEDIAMMEAERRMGA